MKVSTVILTTLVTLFTFWSTAYANSGFEIAGEEIKNIIEKEYKLKYADSLNDQKKEFHVNNNANFHEATIGAGISYFQLDLHEDILSHKIVGYKFPLFFEGKQVAVVNTRLKSGSPKIFDVSNSNNSDREIKKLESEYANNDKLELIDDERFKLNLLYVKKGSSEQYINLSNNEKISSKDIKETISQLTDSNAHPNIDNSDETVGTGVDTDSSSQKDFSILPIILFGLSLLFAIPVLVMFIKKRKASSKLQKTN